jgi:hypothetical protein
LLDGESARPNRKARISAFNNTTMHLSPFAPEPLLHMVEALMHPILFTIVDYQFHTYTLMATIAMVALFNQGQGKGASGWVAQGFCAPRRTHRMIKITPDYRRSSA